MTGRRHTSVAAKTPSISLSVTLHERQPHTHDTQTKLQAQPNAALRFHRNARPRASVPGQTDPAYTGKI